MVRLTLATGLLTTAFALAPSVGTVVKGNRKITVIGTAHTPSRRQREEVEALIAEVKPDAVLVELDAERLEFAWQQPEEAYGGELAAAVRRRSGCQRDVPCVVGARASPGSWRVHSLARSGRRMGGPRAGHQAAHGRGDPCWHRVARWR